MKVPTMNYPRGGELYEPNQGHHTGGIYYRNDRKGGCGHIYIWLSDPDQETCRAWNIWTNKYITPVSLNYTREKKETGGVAPVLIL